MWLASKDANTNPFASTPSLFFAPGRGLALTGVVGFADPGCSFSAATVIVFLHFRQAAFLPICSSLIFFEKPQLHFAIAIFAFLGIMMCRKIFFNSCGTAPASFYLLLKRAAD
jgi:hypothetical protein